MPAQQLHTHDVNIETLALLEVGNLERDMAHAVEGLWTIAHYLASR